MVRMSSSPAPASAPIPQNGEIDEKRLDILTRKRKRRVQDRNAPSSELREWEKAAQKRAESRPHPPGVILAPAGMDEEHWTSPHNDTSLWTLQLADAFGTRSLAVLSTFMDQLERLCKRTIWDEKAQQWRLDENQFSAALAIINSIKPRNEMEAALAAQMVAVHLLTMKVAARALKYEYETQTIAATGKLARTFTLQMETLQAIRGKGRSTRQTIKVTKELHQHVHYHDARGSGESGAQPHEPREPRAKATAQRTPLPSAQQAGEVVPITSRARKARV